MSNTVSFAGKQFLPIMLSPMAGITHEPFRQLIIELIEQHLGQSVLGDVLPGLFVDEMVSARAVAGKISKVRAKLTFAPNEQFRSVQLHCHDAQYPYIAAQQIANEQMADHIDLNFGCPVKKVTRNGGGSALGANPELLRQIIRAVVAGVEDGAPNPDAIMPISAKFRVGIDDTDVHFLRTAQIAVDEGCQLLTLHARTAAQLYSGSAEWAHIKTLRENVPENILVYANGDIMNVETAVECLEQTGANGVAIGRGALGRPWLFAELAHYFSTGQVIHIRPNLGEVVQIMLRHLLLTIEWMDKKHNEVNAELLAVKLFRTNVGPYLKGFSAKEVKMQVLRATTYAQIEQLLQTLDPTEPYPISVENVPRGKTKSQRKVYLPVNW
jgi:nifR3 family TIM-barrel protein